MTTFIDGPAKGQTLLLKNAPTYMRVVQNAAGKWDALDAPGDTPAVDETCHAYFRHEFRGSCHINRGGGRGGFYAMADYRILGTQPAQEVMKSQKGWEDWVVSQVGGYWK